jgi:hypothetical protein
MKEYDLLTFINDLTSALYMDEHLKNRVTAYYTKDHGTDLYDEYMGCRIDFVTNWILLCNGRCTSSFMTLFAKPKPFTQSTLEYSFVHHSKDSGSDFESIATMMGIVQNYPELIRQYGTSLCKYLSITGSKENSPLDKIN